MTPFEIRLHLTVTEADADAESLEELTTRLLCDLRELGVESVERSTGKAATAGAKSGDPFTLGALALVAVPVILPKLIEFLQAWALRSEKRTVKIKTPAGMEVEFTPEKRLSAADVVALAEKLAHTQYPVDVQHPAAQAQSPEQVVK